MVRLDGAEARKERIQRIAKYVQGGLFKNNGQIPLKRTIAEIAITEGITRDRAIEYLGLLKEVGQFDIDVEKDIIKKISES
jgi:hypothetical protein